MHEDSAHRRQQHFPLLALEKFVAGLPFETANLMADCPVGHAEFIRGVGETLKPGRRLECP
jgi:hypothetical protein